MYWLNNSGTKYLYQSVTLDKYRFYYMFVMVKSYIGIGLVVPKWQMEEGARKLKVWAARWVQSLYMKLTFISGHYVCQFMSKVDQKQTLGRQVEVGSNIAQNRMLSRLEVICGHHMWQLIWKCNQRWKCIKLVGSNNAYYRFKTH